MIADEAEALLNADPTNVALIDQKAVAEGQLAWVLAARPVYTAYVSATQGIEVSYQSHLTAARNTRANDVATADINSARDSAIADRDSDSDSDSVTDGQASATARRGFGNAWATNQENADQAYRWNTSSDEQDYALAVIQAERLYRIGKYGPGGITIEQRNSDQADALAAYQAAKNLNFATWQVESAGIQWVHEQASANQDYTDAQNDAYRLDAYNVQLAVVQRTYDKAIVDADVTESMAIKNAKYQRSVSMASPEFTYRAGLAAAEASAWNALSQETPNAWADAKYRDALGRSNAWAAQSINYTARETQNATAERTYRTQVTTAYLTMGYAIADARYTGSVAISGVAKNTALTRASAGNTYDLALATARRDWYYGDAFAVSPAVVIPGPSGPGWGSAATAESDHFNALQQASEDDIDAWGVAYLQQIDQEADASRDYEQAVAEQRRIRDNATENHDLTFDLAWLTAVKNQVQSQESGSLSPWHDYYYALAQADWAQIAAPNGTRTAEQVFSIASNNAEKDFQWAVSDARVTLAHDRGQVEVDQAADEVDEQLTQAQTDFNNRTALTPPERMVYTSGIGESFPREERGRFIYEDPVMPGY